MSRGEPVRKVMVVSPHFDDVPLSLGESLRNGELRQHRVFVNTVFGRTNWTSRIHPTSGRASAVSRWRRLEEAVASKVFRYRWSAADWSEVILRTGDLDSTTFLDAEADLASEPLVDEIRDWIERQMDAQSDRPDLVLAPAGLGGHRDHMIIAVATSRSVAMSEVPIGFYEDRPYRAYLGDDEIRDHVRRLVPDAVPVVVSPPIRTSTQRLVRACYPSQMTPYFREAMELDAAAASTESVWFSPDDRPDWFGQPV